MPNAPQGKKGQHCLLPRPYCTLIGYIITITIYMFISFPRS